MKPRTTLKFTSASRRATRTSRSASWMLSSVRRPWPPRRSKIVVSLALNESSMESPSLRNYAEHFNSWRSAPCPVRSGVGRGAQLANGLGRIVRLEHGGSGDQNRRAVLGQRTCVRDVHAAVDGDVDAARAEHRADLPDLRIHGGNEFLPAEAR